jgi:hypothetical protein
VSQIVEITMDLTNPNCKPRIEAFEITKITEKNIYCEGRRFYIPNMNEVKYRGFLKYTYRYQTEETDYRKIMESGETEEALKGIMKYLTGDLKCYQRRLDGHIEYCRRNLWCQEAAGVKPYTEEKS